LPCCESETRYRLGTLDGSTPHGRARIIRFGRLRDMDLARAVQFQPFRKSRSAEKGTRTPFLVSAEESNGQG
jgi:hypothetical protein